MTENGDARAVAEGYHALGHNVVPFCFIKEGEKEAKKPLTQWKEWITRRQTKEEFDSLPWDRAQGFGLVCGTKNDQGYYLGVVDYDTKDPKLSEEVKKHGRKVLTNMPITQMEKTRNNGFHYIYLSKQPVRTVKDYRETAALELQGEGSLIIMAPSEGYKRLNDNTPTIVEDLKETFLEAVEKAGIPVRREKDDAEPEKSYPPGPFRIDQIINVSLLPIHSGDERQGTHPFHGSDGGTNFSVNLKKNVWHCWRHDTGGGPLQLLAVKEGLLTCDQAGKGAIDPKMYRRLMKLAEEQGLITKEEEKKKGSQADRLVNLCLAQDAELFVDQYGMPFIRYTEEFCYDDVDDVDSEFDYFLAKNKNEEKTEKPDKVTETPPTSSHRHITCRKRSVNCAVNSKRFKTWLAYMFWEAEGKAPGSEGLSSAINVLMGKASAEGKAYTLHNRVAPAEDGVWLDMTDEAWRGIKITSAGWEVIDNPPILFRRYNHQKPLTVPEKCALTEARENVYKLFKYLNLRKDDEKNKLMFLCNVISYLIPSIPHPILVVYGPQGAAKSSMCSIVRRLLDPSYIELLNLPRDERELAQQLNHHWLAFYDNKDYLPSWVSDMLCRAVTGAGFSKRELYSDDDDVIYNVLRCISVNGRNIAARKGDLLDRSTLLSVERIDEKDRKTVAELLEGFNMDRRAILGGMLTVLSETLRIFPSIRLREHSRMADFNKYGCAMAQALGKTSEDFLEVYREKVKQQNEEAINADPVALAFLDFCQIHFRRTKEGKLSHENWSGTPTKLLQEIRNHAEAMGIRTDPKHFPRAPNAFMRRINLASSSLQALGFEVLTKGGMNREVVISPGRQVKLLSEDVGIFPQRSHEEDVPVKSCHVHHGEQSGESNPFDKVLFCWNTCRNYRNEEEYGCSHPNPTSLNEKTVRPLKCPGFKPIRQEESP